MMYVQAGTFVMDANSKSAHQVTLTNNYYIGQTEVTQALWKAVMGNNPSHFKGNNKPVESVSWNECVIFISKLNSLMGLKFRLPTEAEWEFAARGGNNTTHFKYSGSYWLPDIAWYELNSHNQSHDVATKHQNELGIYDLSGNVSEWCSDFWGHYTGNAQKNPLGPKNGDNRVSWRKLVRS